MINIFSLKLSGVLRWKIENGSHLQKYISIPENGARFPSWCEGVSDCVGKIAGKADIWSPPAKAVPGIWRPVRDIPVAPTAPDACRSSVWFCDCKWELGC